ncbi:MAG: 3-methyl-2-oxobutanoate dehydrogenase subunit beta [Candidatus Sericytochromatia bacterium]|nr:3-methyl-2-oxobutanoate dehydrogenase subunit beta [Candidatus Sericytochromatia bacterium]
MKKVFISGNKAFAEGAIYAGCRYYYGVPRSINNEILKYMSVRMPEVNGVFTQSENERSAISMVLGSSVAGARVLTSSITDGISAMDEVLNYMCGLELPCVVGNIMSGKFGLKNLEPTQSGYAQAVKSNLSGYSKFIVLAPHTVQETYQLTAKAFDLADKYRNPVIVLMDSALAQLNEQIEIEENLLSPEIVKKDWKVGNNENNKNFNVFKSYHDDESNKYTDILAKFKLIESESLYESFMVEDADEIIISFGLIAKIAKGIVINERQKGRKIGLFRPISLSPFPKEALRSIANKVNKITVLESNSGSMYSDVCKILDNNKKISFFGESEYLSGFRKVIKEFEKGIVTV